MFQNVLHATCVSRRSWRYRIQIWRLSRRVALRHHQLRGVVNFTCEKLKIAAPFSLHWCSTIETLYMALFELHPSLKKTVNYLYDMMYSETQITMTWCYNSGMHVTAACSCCPKWESVVSSLCKDWIHCFVTEHGQHWNPHFLVILCLQS